MYSHRKGRILAVHHFVTEFHLLKTYLSAWHWLQVRQDGTRKKVTGPSVTTTTAPPTKYGLGYRSRTLNPNPKTDLNPNPKSNKNVCSTKRHRNNSQHRVISKSHFRLAGGGYTKGAPPEGGIKLLQK